MQAAGLSGTPAAAFERLDAPILVCLLGGLRLLKLGCAVPVRPGGKTEGLLLHLGIRQGGSLPRDALLERLWPNSKVVLAAQALSSLMNRDWNQKAEQPRSPSGPILWIALYHRTFLPSRYGRPSQPAM